MSYQDTLLAFLVFFLAGFAVSSASFYLGYRCAMKGYQRGFQAFRSFQRFP